MHLALPSQRTVSDNLLPGFVVGLIVLVVAIAIPIHYPMDLEVIRAPDVAIAPGDQVAIDWRQTWHHLCPITVTRQIKGADDFKATAVRFKVDPPAAPGIISRTGRFTVPNLPPGPAVYWAELEPHCWIDHVWQRSYRSHDVPLLIVPKAPPGPR